MIAKIENSPKLQKLLLAARDAAAALDISEKHLWNLTKAGEINCVRLGRSVRYSVAALEEWIDQQQKTN